MESRDSIAGAVFLLSSLYFLFTSIPSLAITFRRLNDTGKSGWYIFVVLVPIFGLLWLLFLLLQPSEKPLNSTNSVVDDILLDNSGNNNTITKPAMNQPLQKIFAVDSYDAAFDVNQMVIQRKPGVFKSEYSYDIYNGETNQLILRCIEPDEKSKVDKLLRYTTLNKSTPVHIDVCKIDGEVLFQIKKSAGKYFSELHIVDNEGYQIARLDTDTKSLKDDLTAYNDQDIALFTVRTPILGGSIEAKTGDGKVLARGKVKSGKDARGNDSDTDTYYFEINDVIPKGNKLRQILFAAFIYCDLKV